MRINDLLATASKPGPPEWFTGEAWMEELGTLPTPTRTRVPRVTSAPGERHRHGAGAGRLMTHPAVHATDPEAGAETVWQEAVGDHDYRRPE